jgi:hypothetical protein
MLKKDQAGMKLETRIIPDAAHNSSEADGCLEGLRSVYAPVSVAVAPPILDQYAGRYAIAPGHAVEILNENGKLVFIGPEGERYATNARSETDFTVRGLELVLHFRRDDAGKVTGFEGERWSGRHFNERLK